MAEGCNSLVLGLEKKAVIKAREEAQDWQRYDMNYNCVFLLKTTTIPYTLPQFLRRKQHFWFIHGLGLYQHVSNKMAVLLVLYMLITRGV